MSQLNVDNIQNRTGSSGGPNFPSGISVAVGQTAYIHGNLQVDGTETIINTETLNVADKTVGIGSTSNASNTTADGSGIEVFASSSQTGNNKTLTWGNTSNSWEFSPNDVGLKVGTGVTVYGGTGIVSATSFKGDGSELTGIDATALKDSNGTVRVQANTSGAEVTGILTATSFEGSGANLTGIDALPSLTGTAYGSIAANKAVQIRSDGQGIEQVVGQLMGWGDEFLLNGSNAGSDPAMCVIGAWGDSGIQNTFAVIYINASDDACCRLGVVNNTTLAVTFGAETVLSTGTCSFPQVVYDNYKAYIVYSWSESSNLVAKVCHTFSGTTQTTFGTTVNVRTSVGYNRCVYEQNSKCVLWNYNNNTTGSGNLYGITAQGSNSGTYLSIGSPTQLADNGSNYNRLAPMIAMWTVAANTNQQGQIAMLYMNNQVPTNGTWWQGVYVNPNNSVSRSGNAFKTDAGVHSSLGFGMIYSESQSQYYQVAITVFQSGNSGYVRTLSVSNTNATNQGATEFESGGSIDYSTETRVVPYDPNTKSFLITYKYTPTGGTGSFVSRTVTFSDPGGSGGWTPTIGPRVTIGDSTDPTRDIVTINTTKTWETASEDKKFVTMFKDASNYNYLTGSVLRPSTTTNLSADAFVGFADTSYTNGQTAKVKVVGNQLTQAGLTTAAKHYVQMDGTVGATAANPSVVAGTALNGNTLLIKP